MQLSLRLSAIADLVTEGNRLVDVGCDHGYLPVYLVQTGKIPAAIAMDVGKGPLSRAREHIARYGLTQYIECRLSDGLAGLMAGEGDTLVIAGMGGPLMERILTEGAAVRDSFSELILQPQSDIPHFRMFLQEQGYETIEEEMVLEDGKFYPMMKAVRPADREDVWKPLTREEAFFGRLLLDRKHPVLRQFLLREKRLREEIQKKLLASPNEKTRRRLAEIEEEKQLIETALRRYEGI